MAGDDDTGVVQVGTGASNNVFQPPEKFSFDAKDWPAWKKRFD